MTTRKTPTAKSGGVSAGWWYAEQAKLPPGRGVSIAFAESAGADTALGRFRDSIDYWLQHNDLEQLSRAVAEAVVPADEKGRAAVVDEVAAAVLEHVGPGSPGHWHLPGHANPDNVMNAAEMAYNQYAGLQAAEKRFRPGGFKGKSTAYREPSGGLFVPEVPLDASQVRDLRRPEPPPETTPTSIQAMRGLQGGASGGGSGSPVGRRTRGWVNPLPGCLPPGVGGTFMDPTRGSHHGIDIVGTQGLGSPVRAAQAGTVHWYRGDEAGWGLMIDHGGGWVTKYAHLGSLDGTLNPYAIPDGSQVAAGQIIGYMGNTGNANYPHLHFSMWFQGVAVDPMAQEVLAGTADFAAIDAQMQNSLQTAANPGQTARSTMAGLLGIMSDSVSGGSKLTYDQVVARRLEQRAAADAQGTIEGGLQQAGEKKGYL